jgi:hypothetical protein
MKKFTTAGLIVSFGLLAVVIFFCIVILNVPFNPEGGPGGGSIMSLLPWPALIAKWSIPLTVIVVLMGIYSFFVKNTTSKSPGSGTTVLWITFLLLILMFFLFRFLFIPF